MTWLDALWLGLLQGLTEYLPVSSSGHLEIANTLLGIQGSDNLTFAVVVHAATVCSTLVVLWREIAGLFAGVFRFHWNEETQYVAKIFLSMIPVGIVGLFFKEEVESVFGNGLLVVGIMLLVTALLLTFAHYARPRRKEKISYKDAIIIGLAQACAVMPGLPFRSLFFSSSSASFFKYSEPNEFNSVTFPSLMSWFTLSVTSTIRSTNLKVNPGVGSSSARLFAQNPSVR